MVHHTERRSQTHAGLSELRMIEQVEYFSAKLQASLLGYIEGFVGRKIVVRHSGNPKACVNPGFISIREGSRLREAARVEPLFSCDRTVARYALFASWSVVWPDDATTQAEARGAASKILRQRIRGPRESDWNAGPESRDSINAPTTDNGVRHCVDVREVHLTMPEGQIEPIVYDEVVPDILLANRLFSPKVVQILNESCTSLAV